MMVRVSWSRSQQKCRVWILLMADDEGRESAKTEDGSERVDRV